MVVYPISTIEGEFRHKINFDHESIYLRVPTNSIHKSIKVMSLDLKNNMILVGYYKAL